ASLPSGTVAFTRNVEDATVEAVRRAKAQLQPARLGMGTGTSYVNINRREFSTRQGWWLGFNENGPSDKTVAVVRFDDLAGRPMRSPLRTSSQDAQRTPS